MEPLDLVQAMLTEEAGPTSLFKMLCEQHLGPPQKVHFLQPKASRQKQIKALQRTLYDTMFPRLKGPGRSHAKVSQLGEVESIYAIAFDLRVQRRFDEADKLEHFVTKFQKNEDRTFSQKRAILKLLLCLQGTGQSEPEHFVGHGTTKLPVVFPDKSIQRVLPSGPPQYGDSVHPTGGRMFMHYPKEIFEHAGKRLDSWSMGSTLDMQIFNATPGTGLHGRGLFDTSSLQPGIYHEKNRLTLFGALVDSHASSLDTRLDTPEITGEGHKGVWQMRVPKLGLEHSSVDEGFVDTSRPSSVTPSSGSGVRAASPDIWDLALMGKSSRYHTWERRGRYEEFSERPYVTEGGPKVFDHLYDLHMDLLKLLDPTIQLVPRHTIPMRQLVTDAIYALIGAPSETFFLDQETGQFKLEDGFHISGPSPEATLQACTPIMQCGDHYRRLCHFARFKVVDSTNQAGLIYRAFSGAVWKYLEHYVASVLSIPKDKTLMQLCYGMSKVFDQISHLAALCKCKLSAKGGPGADKLPVGVHLLSYLYEETVDAAGSPHYPMMLSLLHTTCGPYIMFVQDWVFQGVCRDTCGEFMIQVNDGYLEYRDKHYWTQGYVLLNEVEDTVPLFLKSLANDIFVCGKSINLLRLCAPQHFLFSIEHAVPRITISFSEEELNSLDSRCQIYLSRMKEIARQQTVSRDELKSRAEKAKHDLLLRARHSAAREIHRLQAKILDSKRSQDARKRKLFTELKTQMEQDLRRRAGEKEQEEEEDKARMESATRQEILEGQVDDDLEKRAREELIDYYSKLTEAAAFREMKAMWHVRRRRLHGRRLDFMDEEEDALVLELESNPLPVHSRPTWENMATASAASGPGPQPGDPSAPTGPGSGPVVTTETDGELPAWARDGATMKEVVDERQDVTPDLPKWAQEGLKKPVPAFGLDAPSPESLPGWAKRGMDTEEEGPVYVDPVKLAEEKEDEGQGQAGQKVKGSMADCMELPEAIDGARVGLKQLPALEIVAEDPDAKKSKSHPSDSTIGNLMYTEPQKEKKAAETTDSAESVAPEESSDVGTPEVEPSVKTPERTIDQDDQDPKSLSTPQKMPIVKKSPKSAIKMVQGQHIAMETTEDTETRASVKVQDDFHATTESEGTSETKSTIKITDEMHATKESATSDEADKPHVKMSTAMSATKESEGEVTERKHIRTMAGKHSSVETTEDVRKRTHVRLNPDVYHSLESVPEVPKLPRRNMFGHVSQISRDGGVDFQAPKLKRQGTQFVSMESDWFTYQIKPYKKRVGGESVDKQSTEERLLAPRLKTSDAMYATKESEFVDHDANRLEKFRQQNVFGHSSDSSVQRLLYYGKGPLEGEVTGDGPLTTVYELVHDTQVMPLPDSFEYLNNAPVADLQANMGQDAFSGLSDYSLGAKSAIDAHTFASLPALLKRSVTALIQAQFSLVSQSVINYFMVDLAIEEHFKALRCFLLMEDGEFGQSLSDQLFEKLASNPPPHEMLNPMFLNAVLSKALRSSLNGDKQHAQNLSFSVKYLPAVLHQNAADALDCLDLTYKVAWPVNIVITDASLVKYSQLFSFMLQLKRTVWVLKDIFHKLKRDVTVLTGVSGMQFRQLQLHRHEMQHFVKVIQGYIANQIIHVTWQEFEEDLSNQAHNVDDLCRRHFEYLNTSLCRCLLNKKAKPVMKIIQDIFGLILKFRMLLISERWRLDRQSGELRHPAFEAMCKTYSHFNEYSRFLFKVVNKLAVRGYQPHLQELLLRLNFNNYYKADL